MGEGQEHPRVYDPNEEIYLYTDIDGEPVYGQR